MHEYECTRTNILVNDLNYCYMCPGIHIEVLEFLNDRLNQAENTYAVLVMDEMNIKEDLVYDKHTGNITGYVNLGTTEQQLLLLEQNKEACVATHILQFMIRRVSQKLDYPLAHFTSSNLISDHLFPIVWDVIAKLEGMDVKAFAITADGATQNLTFLQMYQDPIHCKNWCANLAHVLFHTRAEMTHFCTYTVQFQHMCYFDTHKCAETTHLTAYKQNC